MKFRDLLGVARDLGGLAMATGHYVRRTIGPAGPELRRAADASRDQSYFLFSTTREQLDFLRFPLGAMPKPQVRAIADAFGLTVAEKPDSQDICFVPEGKYAAVVERLRPGSAEPGDIVQLDGETIGRHQGVIHYTVGQRRGLGVAAGEPLFVVALDAARRRVVVGPRAALFARTVLLKETSWLGDGRLESAASRGARIAVKVRSTRPPSSARLRLVDGVAAVELDAPEEGVAPGQACVFYDAEEHDRVLGGGWILRAESALKVAGGAGVPA